MSEFHVSWVKDALDELTQIWLDYPSERDAVTRATAAVDLLLIENPQGRGEHLSEGLRVLNCAPLRILYTVSETARRVEIVKVKLRVSS